MKLITRQSVQSWCLLAWGLVLIAVSSVHAQENFQQTPGGVRFKLGRTQVEMTAPTKEVLRLSLNRGDQAQLTPSTFFESTNPDASVVWHVVKQDNWVGIQSQAGELLMNPQSGEWTLKNAAGEVVIPLHVIGDWKREAASTNLQIELGWDKHQVVGFYGCGNGVGTLRQSHATTGVSNGRAVIPYYWAPAGYAVLAVSANDNQPASWQAATNGVGLTWTFPGASADLYLMPAASLKDAARVYAHLTGSAPVPPRWAFGYLQSRWGWTDRAYIVDTLKHIEDLKLPVDAFIFDFEWYTTTPDYGVPPEGVAGFNDFGWNTNLFPELAKQIAEYKKQGVRFVGIRKPRLGNADALKMMRTNGWQLAEPQGEQYHARDINFANSKFSEWYVQQSRPLFRAGVDGWWNDEGEGSFTTYYYWNLAETQAQACYRSNHRLWTLNRAFSPGVQRLGAGAWTGDIKASWEAFAETPVSLLNWSLAGMPYSACDIGGFYETPSPELLSRWMEAGVFFPIMRSHSHIAAKPHFPWLYGTNALHAIRAALELRYRLIPFYYSLAHETFETGVPWMRPLVMEFPNDPKVANLSDEWMMGDSLLAVPILQTNDTRSIYLPAADWYVLGTNHFVAGNQTISVTAGLDEIPAYVRAGSILPLAPVIQHTSQLPGGALELQIYPGKDATFTLVEDDGETLNYQKGKIRRTTFQWNDAAGQLTWKREGKYAGKDVFKKMRAVLFDPKGIVQAEHNLSDQGSLVLRAPK